MSVGDKTVVHIDILLLFFLTGMVLEGENSWRGREEYLKEWQISNNRECMYQGSGQDHVFSVMSQLVINPCTRWANSAKKSPYRYFHGEGAKEIQSDYRK